MKDLKPLICAFGQIIIESYLSTSMEVGRSLKKSISFKVMSKMFVKSNSRI